jgi:hypothetical protein
VSGIAVGGRDLCQGAQAVALRLPIDQSGQVIDVYVSTRRDGGAARCFFTRALANTKVIRWRSPPTGRSSIRMFSMS